MSRILAPVHGRIARIAASITPSGSTPRFSSSYVSVWFQMLGLGTTLLESNGSVIRTVRPASVA